MSSSPQIIPLTSNPNQSFQVPLSIDGTVKTLSGFIRYNEIADYWVMTLSDSQGNLILDSIPFVTGNVPSSNILRQFAYLAIGSAFVLNASNVASPDFPDDTDLGDDFVILWDNTPAE
jgi:hypothetical protein